MNLPATRGILAALGVNLRRAHRLPEVGGNRRGPRRGPRVRDGRGRRGALGARPRGSGRIDSNLIRGIFKFVGEDYG